MKPDRLSTQVIVTRIQRGERELFDELYRRYADRLGLVARCRLPRRLRPKLDSMDLVQSSFREAVEHIDQFRGYESEGQFLAWLSKILLNKLRSKLEYYGAAQRNVDREMPGSDGLDGNGARGKPAGAGTMLSLMEDLDRLEVVLLDLPDDYRELILLKWFEGRSWEEVGRHFDCTPGAAQQRGLRAQARLSSLWRARFGPEAED